MNTQTNGRGIAPPQRMGDRYIIEVNGRSEDPLFLREVHKRLKELHFDENVRVYREHFYDGKNDWLPVPLGELG